MAYSFGTRPTPPTQKWVKHDQRLNTVIESYDTYDDVLDYLKLIECLMGC